MHGRTISDTDQVGLVCVLNLCLYQKTTSRKLSTRPSCLVYEEDLSQGQPAHAQREQA